MKISKRFLADLANQSLLDVLDMRKGNQYLNPRYEPSTIRELIKGYDRFLGLLSCMVDRALSLENSSDPNAQVLPVKVMLRAIILNFDCSAVNPKPEYHFARAILNRIESMPAQGSQTDRKRVDELKQAVLEASSNNNRLRGYVEWAHRCLDGMDSDFIVESLESLCIELSNDELNASYSDCAETRCKELSECKAKREIVSIMKSSFPDPGICESWKTLIHENKYSNIFNNKVLPNILLDADREFMKRVTHYSEICNKIQEIADKTPGMWHATFSFFQNILLGVYGFDEIIMRSQLESGYNDAMKTIGIYCKDEYLPRNHTTLKAVKLIMEDALRFGTVSEGDKLKYSEFN